MHLTLFSAQFKKEWRYTATSAYCMMCTAKTLFYSRYTPGKFLNVALEKDGKISWTDRVRNEEVLLAVKEQRNVLHEISKRKANWIGHILRRNSLLQRVIEGKIK